MSSSKTICYPLVTKQDKTAKGFKRFKAYVYYTR